MSMSYDIAMSMSYDSTMPMTYAATDRPTRQPAKSAMSRHPVTDSPMMHPTLKPVIESGTDDGTMSISYGSDMSMRYSYAPTTEWSTYSPTHDPESPA